MIQTVIMALFDILQYWHDPVPRKGAHNMAVDQLLLDRIAEYPVLRIYHWSEPAVSFGYFHRVQDAMRAFPATTSRPLTYIRRWSGGGIVDHRIDLTYTLVVPRGAELARLPGAQSYRSVHQALASALLKLGQEVQLAPTDRDAAGHVCFNNAVGHDLTDVSGCKVAGAGQRRTRKGLLHQGSVMTEIEASILGKELAAALAGVVKPWHAAGGFEAEVGMISAERYASKQWLMRK